MNGRSRPKELRINFSPFFDCHLTLFSSTFHLRPVLVYARKQEAYNRIQEPLGLLGPRSCLLRPLLPKGSDSCPPSQQGPNHITTWQTYHLFNSAYFAYLYGLGPSYRLLTAPSSRPSSLPSDRPSTHQIKSLGSVPLIYYQYASLPQSTGD